MHHFIYPSKDTYISSRPGFPEKNFGIDELLQVGTSNVIVRSISPTKDYSYTNVIFSNYNVENFTGNFTGSIKGNVSNLTGSLSGSALVFTASYFSGSYNGVSDIYSSASLAGFSGSLIGTLTGSFSSSAFIGIFTGSLTGSVGCLNGTASGIDTRTEANWISTVTKYVDRSLLHFNLDVISSSIADGTIPAPRFHLKMKVCNEYELPITYTIYALPVSQSWNMGNGYYSDGGSTDGVSWKFRDFDEGTKWWPTYTSSARPAIDFITTPTSATGSFERGGGTWYTGSTVTWYTASLTSSQVFDYAASDIDMDVTETVMAWLSGSIPNEGFIVLSSDELRSTGSGFTLKFFSRDTNTIYSPYLDVMWPGNGMGGSDSSEYVTASLATGSVTITDVSSGMSVSIQSGSTFSIAGGVAGVFSGSTFLLTSNHSITASNAVLAEVYQLVSGSFTGSFYGAAASISGSLTGSGWFTASYFSGSVDGTSYEVNDTGISGSVITASLSGSINTTGSVGLFVGSISGSSIGLTGTFTGYYLDESYLRVNGIVDGTGLSGNIENMSVVGNYEGIMSGLTGVVGPCGTGFSASLVTASLTSGIFSGSSFTAYYTDDRKLENAQLTGSWTEAALLGATVNIPIPSGVEPFAYAYVQGTYIWGTALGTYTISGSISASVGSDSASFSGQFIEGPLLGGYINMQLSGSIYTSSYQYTSSVTYTSTGLTALNISNPFVVVLQNVRPVYKAGDIVKIGVFGRKQYPLKSFGTATQQTQYLVPEYLPSSSYYALKDEETGEIVMDFDSYTRLSCEYPKGNFFVVDTTGIPQERYYRVLIRVEGSGSKYTTDSGKIFKITR